jgi:hypothetical protein
MSQSYKLLYRDRRQFVFEETTETHSTAIMTLILGFLLGSLIGVYFASLDLTTAGSILLAMGTYVTVITSTFSLRSNPLGVVIIFFTSFGAVIVLTYVSRLTLSYLQESRFKLVLVYAGVFAIMAELLYLWSRLTWVEDVRMHQLVLDKTSEPSSSKPPELCLGAFFRWLVEQLFFFLYHVYYLVLHDFDKAGQYPVLFIERWSTWNLSASRTPIRIENDTLKRVKVCVYHWSDYCCWVPVGGIVGGMHVLDRGDEISIYPHWPSEFFRIKIFAHGMIDFELATHASVFRGKKYKFIDVGKPITLVTMGSPPPTEHDDDGQSSSSSECHLPSPHSDMFLHVENMTRSASSGGLRRIPSSRANLCLSTPSSPNNSAASLQTPHGNRRKKEFKESLLLMDLSHAIAVLNESTADVKISFYNIDDISFVIGLDCFRAKHAAEGVPVIPKGEWKVFELSAQETLRRSQNPEWDRKFCMRVKINATTMELSYCTAILGDALVVRDAIAG